MTPKGYPKHTYVILCYQLDMYICISHHILIMFTSWIFLIKKQTMCLFFQIFLSGFDVFDQNGGEFAIW